MGADLTVGEVARRAGVSTRVLRHYGAIGLFPPCRVGANGYRYYAEERLPRLFRILALRRSGLGLEAIADVVSDGVGEADALRGHLAELRAERARLDALISGIAEHVDRLDTPAEGTAERIADREADGAAFAERLDAGFGPGAAAALPDAGPGPLSAADREHLVADSARLFGACAALLRRGQPPGGAAAAELMAEHYAQTRRYWPATLEQYRAMGRLYETDPLQRSIAAAADPRLPSWLAEAVAAFAEARLGRG